MRQVCSVPAAARCPSERIASSSSSRENRWKYRKATWRICLLLAHWTIDDVMEVVMRVAAGARDRRGYRIVSEPPALRHFTARFEPLG